MDTEGRRLRFPSFEHPAAPVRAIRTAVDNRSYRIEADTNGDAADDYFSGIRLWADW